MRRWTCRATLVAGTLMLSGCALMEQLSSGESASAPSTGDLQRQVDWAEPEVAETNSQDSQKTTDDRIPRPKIKPELLDPNTLVGLDKSAITRILGEPQSITLAQPATVWAWHRDGCRMRLFFYPDLAKQNFRALTYEISTDEKGAAALKRNAMLIETCASRIKWANVATTE